LQFGGSITRFLSSPFHGLFFRLLSESQHSKGWVIFTRPLRGLLNYFAFYHAFGVKSCFLGCGPGVARATRLPPATICNRYVIGASPVCNRYTVRDSETIYNRYVVGPMLGVGVVPDSGGGGVSDGLRRGLRSV
jgi:hypothetical protein